jgi:hypothetical protein
VEARLGSSALAAGLPFATRVGVSVDGLPPLSNASVVARADQGRIIEPPLRGSAGLGTDWWERSGGGPARTLLPLLPEATKVVQTVPWAITRVGGPLVKGSGYGVGALGELGTAFANTLGHFNPADGQAVGSMVQQLPGLYQSGANAALGQVDGFFRAPQQHDPNDVPASGKLRAWIDQAERTPVAGYFAFRLGQNNPVVSDIQQAAIAGGDHWRSLVQHRQQYSHLQAEDALAHF